MRIIFNPFYDKRVFIDWQHRTNQQIWEQKVVGKSGLLSELELRLGLTASKLSQTERIIAYADAMRQTDNSAMFFHKSFLADAMETASVLLSWRDRLVYAGWNASMVNSSKLSGLATIEPFFHAHGEADGWQKVLKKLQQSINMDDWQIEVTCPACFLDHTQQILLNRLTEHGAAVTYRNIDSSPTDASIVLHSFYTDIEAHTWVVEQQLADSDVLVGFDTAILHDILIATGKSTCANSETGIGALMQLIPLTMGLFETPVNAANLLNYLRLPKSPARENEQWLDIIHQLENGGLTIDIPESIALWKSSAIKDGKCKVKKEKVQQSITHLRKWANKAAHANFLLSGQLYAVADGCRLLELILDQQPEEFNFDDLTLLTRKVVEPIVLNVDEAQVGSPNILSNLIQVVDAPTNLYLFGNAIDTLSGYADDFLSQQEIEFLSHQQVFFPTQNELAKQYYTLCKQAFSKVKGTIHIVECAVQGGAKSAESLLLTEVKSSSTYKHGETDIDYNTITVPALKYKKSVHNVSPDILKDKKRERESFSSLDMLIQTPIEYVMHYLLGWSSYGAEDMTDLKIVQGNVAHLYIEKLTNLCSCQLSQMETMHRSKFDQMVDDCILEKGIVLFQTENLLTQKTFRRQLKKAVDTLLDIISQNQLTIVGSEVEYTCDIPKIGPMLAKVDYVLKNKHGEYLLFDFKWSDSVHYYEDKVKNNRALQLALYRSIVETALHKENARVVYTGFFQLLKNVMYTADHSLYENEHIVVVDSVNSADIVAQAANSYEYRYQQIQNGILEEGEGLQMADLRYAQDTNNFNLYPLNGAYEDADVKANPLSSFSDILKGNIV